MTTEKTKSSSKIRLKSSDSIEQLRRKSTDYFFQPISSTNDLIHQRKPPSPFQTGLKYLKFLGQIKRQNEQISHIKSSPVLERTSAFSTNYYAPLPPLSCHHLINKSIQVDNLSSKIISYLSFYEFFFILISILVFISFIFLLKFNSYPIHCLLHKKFWYPIQFSDGFQCQSTNIEIHYIEIYSLIYQIEIQKKNLQTNNCLGFNILSCLPIDYLLIPKGQVIHRNNQLIKYCNHTQKINCQNSSLSIPSYEYKWNLKNTQLNNLFHCSCLTNINQTKCFHFMITNQCDLHIPWFNYCLKYSTIHSTCQAYIHSSR